MKTIVSGQLGPAPAEADRSGSARSALAGLSLSILLASLGTSIANVALPTLAAAFDAPFQDVQWVVIAYLLAITVVIVGVGRLGDIVGGRRLLTGGILLFAAASVMCAVAPTLWLLVAARVAQGLGAAVMMALAMALVGETVPKARAGSAMGLLGTMSAVGTALGPSLGGLLIAGLGWRAIFLAGIPLAIAALVLTLRGLPVDRRPPGADRARFDSVGTLLLALTLMAYALAMTIGRGRFDLINGALLLTSVVGASLFVGSQRRTVSPLVELATLSNARLRASLATNSLVSTVMMATLVVGPFYLTRGLRLDEAVVGAAMSVGPIVSALSGVPAGRTVDRLGARRVAVLGLLAMLCGAMALSVLPALFGLAGYVAAIGILTPGYQLFQAANNTMVMSDVRAERRGVVSGMLNLSRNLGLITGASVMGAVFTIASGTPDVATAPAEAVAGGMQIAFAVSAILVVIALAVVAVASRTPEADPA